MRSDDVACACTRAVREALREADIRDKRGPADHREVAIRQAAGMESQRLVNVELRRERDKAVADREAALDLADKYAQLAGVVGPDRDAALRYVEAYHESWRRIEAERLLLHGQRWEVHRLAMQAREIAAGERTFDIDVSVPEFAKWVADALTKVCSAQNTTVQKAPELFPLPGVPQQPNREPRRVPVQPPGEDGQGGLFDVAASDLNNTPAPTPPALASPVRRRQLVTADLNSGLL
jgi:hypothetical protein